MLLEQVELADKTTLKVGGPADFFCRVTEVAELERSVREAEQKSLNVFYLGEGSNVLFADAGYRGLVVQNGMSGRTRQGREIWVAGGENLPLLITWLNGQHLGGMERMFGIPGTVAGAIVGNAGAYGQEISQVLRQVRVWQQGSVRDYDASELELKYRHSRFKVERDAFILSCILELRPDPGDLMSISTEILRTRQEKYPPNLRCPGSFFKNVIFEELAPEIQRRLPPDFVMYGKVPAGKLLEAVGANGAQLGQARIAGYHGNLLINENQASSHDILELAQKYADLVYERFGIELEPEIRLAGEWM